MQGVEGLSSEAGHEGVHANKGNAQKYFKQFAPGRGGGGGGGYIGILVIEGAKEAKFTKPQKVNWAKTEPPKKSSGPA